MKDTWLEYRICHNCWLRWLNILVRWNSNSLACRCWQFSQLCVTVGLLRYSPWLGILQLAPRSTNIISCDFFDITIRMLYKCYHCLSTWISKLHFTSVDSDNWHERIDLVLLSEVTWTNWQIRFYKILSTFLYIYSLYDVLLTTFFCKLKICHLFKCNESIRMFCYHVTT